MLPLLLEGLDLHDFIRFRRWYLTITLHQFREGNLSNSLIKMILTDDGEAIEVED